MEAVRNLIAQLGFDPAVTTINGTVALRLAENKKNAFGTQVDEYVPFCSALALSTPEQSVTLEGGTPEFKQLAKAVISHAKLPLYTIQTLPGSEPPPSTAPISIGYGGFDEWVAADEEWFMAILSGDDAKADEMEWRKFRLLPIFAKSPCDRVVYDMLRTSWSESGHIRTLDFPRYYEWYRTSETNLDAAGCLNGETVAKVTDIVEAYISGSSDPSVARIAVHNTWKPHPLHRQLYRDLVDGLLEAPRAASGPRP